MKLVFAILVLLALFTEGKGKSGLQHANHKNHTLNMRKVAKTALLHEHEALADSISTAMPNLPLPESFQFPVEVDFTEFEDKLEQRFTSINEDIKEVRTSLESLKSTGISLCQTGVQGCSECKSEDPGPGDSYHCWKYPIHFPKAFPGTPTITTALNEIYQIAPGGEDWYGWQSSAIDITSSHFTLYIKLSDRKITKFYVNWIACYTL